MLSLCGPGADDVASVGSERVEYQMTGPFRGLSGQLGVEMRRGILAQFTSVNDAGGISGRRLELDVRPTPEREQPRPGVLGTPEVELARRLAARTERVGMDSPLAWLRPIDSEHSASAQALRSWYVAAFQGPRQGLYDGGTGEVAGADGATVAGPALIDTGETTCVVPEGWTATKVDATADQWTRWTPENIAKDPVKVQFEGKIQEIVREGDTSSAVSVVFSATAGAHSECTPGELLGNTTPMASPRAKKLSICPLTTP